MARVSAQLGRFPGGLRLPHHKRESTGYPIASLPLPAQLVVPVQQHIGAPAEVLVEVGQRVLKGQLLARAGESVSAAVHAPSSGFVSAVEARAIPHPSALPARCVVIDTDGRDEWIALPPPIDNPFTVDIDTLRTRVRDAGIVGLGGAGFPTHIKLTPEANPSLDTLIINGAECEPYITCDEMLLRERAMEVLSGARIMQQILGVARCVIGIEDNMPEALAALTAARAALGEVVRDIEIIAVPTRYPAGGEKQLIKTLTNRDVPSQKLPLAVGVVCHNVATAAAVFQAVKYGKPLIARIVTVTGPAVATPRNFEVLLGTPLRALIDAAGGYTGPTPHLRMGGPMMGLPLPSDTLPVIKTCNCLLVTPPPVVVAEQPCIRCGECVDVCPATLLPQQLYWHARAKEFDKLQTQRLFDCIECGCCDYVCPSHIPLVAYYRYAKTEIWSQDEEKRKAALARRRHEARVERLERDKAERAARMQKHKLDSRSDSSADSDSKKAAVQAALERVKAKQQGASDDA